MQDITQSEHTLKLEVFIHNDETVNSGFSDGIKDGVQSIVERAGVNARETLADHKHIYHTSLEAFHIPENVSSTLRQP